MMNEERRMKNVRPDGGILRSSFFFVATSLRFLCMLLYADFSSFLILHLHHFLRKSCLCRNTYCSCVCRLHQGRSHSKSGKAQHRRSPNALEARRHTVMAQTKRITQTAAITAVQIHSCCQMLMANPANVQSPNNTEEPVSTAVQYPTPPW